MNRLKALSKDEKTRRLAQQRSIAARMHYETMCASKDEGREEGRAEGRAEGQASLLLEMLSDKFGNVPEDTIHQVRTAPSEQLRSWSRRLLKARSLDEVFGDQ